MKVSLKCISLLPTTNKDISYMSFGNLLTLYYIVINNDNNYIVR